MIKGAVIYAKELERLVTFYSALGFVKEEMKPEKYAILVSGSTELNIVQIPEQIAASIEIASPPRIRSNTPIKLTFVVPTLSHALTAIKSQGGLTKGKEWKFNGQLIQDVIDPEGNVLQLVQPGGV